MKSMPSFSPEKISEMSPGMMTRSEISEPQFALAGELRHGLLELLGADRSISCRGRSAPAAAGAEPPAVV